MRVFGNCYELISEIYRDVAEMGKVVHPHSMQNKQVQYLEGYSTLEIIGYGYILLSLDKSDYLFLGDPRSKDWVQAELRERLWEAPNPGKAWKIREDVWKEFLVNGKFDYTYGERFHEYRALKNIVDEIKDNPDSRQLILSVWDRTDIHHIGGKSRVPCSIYYQFLVREGAVHIIYNQRSADVITHFGNDVWLAYNLMVKVAEFTGLEPGYLHHNIGSLHVYQKDLELLQTCINHRL